MLLGRWGKRQGWAYPSGCALREGVELAFLSPPAINTNSYTHGPQRQWFPQALSTNVPRRPVVEQPSATLPFKSLSLTLRRLCDCTGVELPPPRSACMHTCSAHLSTITTTTTSTNSWMVFLCFARREQTTGPAKRPAGTPARPLESARILAAEPGRGQASHRRAPVVLAACLQRRRRRRSPGLLVRGFRDPPRSWRRGSSSGVGVAPR